MTGVGVLAAEKFWILDPLYQTLGTLVAWFYSIIPSYGVAIALLTLAVRIITLPLTAKQARSQQQMQRLAPELKRLQAKHKNDKQKLNEEMMKFYKENHANPFGGCLPVLIQAPVLIVLYRLILGLTAQPDPKHIPKSSALFEALKESGGTMISWGIDLAQAPAKVAGADKFPYLILVALVVATGYYQQRQLTARVSKENVNPQMAMMTKIFPVMFGFFSFITPAGVVVYFLVSNIWQIGQQAFMFRNQPAPDAPSKDAPAKGGEAKPSKGGTAKGTGAKGTAGKSGSGKAAAGGPKGKVAAGPPAKGSGAKGPKAGAGKGGARGPGRGGPPPRGTGAKSSGNRSPGAKSSGKGTPRNRPSGRVTPPKSGQPAGKARPAAKGAAAGARSTTPAETKQRWWQKLRATPEPLAAPPPKTGASKPATGAKKSKGGGGSPRPRPKSGVAKGGAPTSAGPAGVKPSGTEPPDRQAAPKGTSTEAPAKRHDESPGTVVPGGSGNGRASEASSGGEASTRAAAGGQPASNGSGDTRAKSDEPTKGRDQAPGEVAGAGTDGDGGPGARSPDEAQKGDE